MWLHNDATLWEYRRSTGAEVAGSLAYTPLPREWSQTRIMGGYKRLGVHHQSLPSTLGWWWVGRFLALFNTKTVTLNTKTLKILPWDETYRWPKNGATISCKYSEIPWPNCVEIGELLQYYMLNTVFNFLFKNFIALWRHLAKTQLLSFIHIVQIDLSITQ